jgi:hypothetical protein
MRRGLRDNAGGNEALDEVHGREKRCEYVEHAGFHRVLRALAYRVLRKALFRSIGLVSDSVQDGEC